MRLRSWFGSHISLVLALLLFSVLFAFAGPARAMDSWVKCDSPYASVCHRLYLKMGGDEMPFNDVVDADEKVTKRGFGSIVADANPVPRDKNGKPRWSSHNLTSFFIPAPRTHVELPEKALEQSMSVTWTEVPNSNGAYVASYGDAEMNAKIKRWNVCLRLLGWNCWTTHRALFGEFSYQEALAASKDVNGIDDWNRIPRKAEGWIFVAAPVVHRFAKDEVRPTSVTWKESGIKGFYVPEYTSNPATTTASRATPTGVTVAEIQKEIGTSSAPSAVADGTASEATPWWKTTEFFGYAGVIGLFIALIMVIVWLRRRQTEFVATEVPVESERLVPTVPDTPRHSSFSMPAH